MPVSISLEGMPLDQDGALDPDQVMLQFICNTGGDVPEHDPEKPPDERVRPSHAALHGRLFTLDAMAPFPPLSYGCRCSMAYVAKERTMASRVLDVASAAIPEATVTPAFAAWLAKNAPGWEKIAEAAAKAAPGQEAAEAYLVAKRLGYTREIAQMSMQVALAKKTAG